MKTTKLLKVGALVLATLTIFAGCTGAKNDKVAQETVQTALVNSSKVISGTYDVALSGKVTAAKGATAQFKEANGSAEFSGVYDKKVKGDPKLTLKVDIKGTLDAGKEQAVNGELRLTGKTMYFSVANLSIDGIPAEYQAVITKLLGKWWSIVVPAESLTQLDAAPADKDLTPQEKQLKDLEEKTQYFKNVSDMGADKVGTIDAEKYSVELDKDAVKNYLVEAAKIKGQEATSADITGLDNLMKLVDFKGNVWINKADNTLAKVDGAVVVSPGTETENLAMTFQATYTATAGDVKVDVPAGAQTFDLAKIMGAPATK